MNVDRRRFLQGAAAVAGTAALPPAAFAASTPAELVAGVFRQKVRADGPDTAVEGYFMGLAKRSFAVE